ncbi:MAG: acyl-ACP--UDP-N-acetylglucosamine O-acyltransferase [Bdellovibrionales bacterium]|nr:acyl-ACP--UDP-N-acetylglucosamine O-acyltransferase [Bdellovibrionales bacterium]
MELIHPSAIVHPSAVVSEGARIGAGVEIGPFSVIGPQVILGDGCRLSSHVVVSGKTTIGKENAIFQFASIGAEPQDLKYRNEPSELLIGDNNTIREYVTLQPGTEGGGMVTSIGSGNLFMACSHVGHDAHLGNRNIVANSAAISGHVQIGDFVTVGGLVGIHQFVRVGDFAFVGAGAMVNQDIPPYCLAQGDRAQLYGINIIGLRRKEFSQPTIRALKETYRGLFFGSGKMKERIQQLRTQGGDFESPHVEKFLKFVEQSERGIASASKIDDAGTSQ